MKETFGFHFFFIFFLLFRFLFGLIFSFNIIFLLSWFLFGLFLSLLFFLNINLFLSLLNWLLFRILSSFSLLFISLCILFLCLLWSPDWTFQVGISKHFRIINRFWEWFKVDFVNICRDLTEWFILYEIFQISFSKDFSVWISWCIIDIFALFVILSKRLLLCWLLILCLLLCLLLWLLLFLFFFLFLFLLLFLLFWYNWCFYNLLNFLLCFFLLGRFHPWVILINNVVEIGLSKNVSIWSRWVVDIFLENILTKWLLLHPWVVLINNIF